jgi:hypothetical protein
LRRVCVWSISDADHRWMRTSLTFTLRLLKSPIRLTCFCSGVSANQRTTSHLETSSPRCQRGRLTSCRIPPTPRNPSIINRNTFKPGVLHPLLELFRRVWVTPLTFQCSLNIMDEKAKKRPPPDVWVKCVDQVTAGVECRHLKLAQENKAAGTEDLVDSRYELAEVARACRCRRETEIRPPEGRHCREWWSGVEDEPNVRRRP